MDDYELKLLEEAQLSGYDSIADYLKSGNAPLESDPYQGYDEDYGPDIDDDPNRIWTEDKTGEYDINKRFKENLNPDVKDNKWVRKSYTKRWDTPEALKFLKYCINSSAAHVASASLRIISFYILNDLFKILISHFLRIWNIPLNSFFCSYGWTRITTTH